MALMVVAPKVVLMILALPHMLRSRGPNRILVGAVVVFVAIFALIRTQTRIGGRAFLGSIIPHHSGPIMMCRGKLTDLQILWLCGEIKRSQPRVDEVKRILPRQ